MNAFLCLPSVIHNQLWKCTENEYSSAESVWQKLLLRFSGARSPAALLCFCAGRDFCFHRCCSFRRLRFDGAPLSRTTKYHFVENPMRHVRVKFNLQPFTWASPEDYIISSECSFEEVIILCEMEFLDDP